MYVMLIHFGIESAHAPDVILFSKVEYGFTKKEEISQGWE